MRKCKDFCILGKISFGFGGKIYTDVIRFCSTCGVFMKINGYQCGCCGSQVRCKSHTKQWKKLKRIRGIEV